MRPRARRVLALIGWGVLVFLSAGFAVNHLAGIVVYSSDDTDRLMMLAFVAVSLLALVILLVPYRRREPWAWVAIWLQVALFAVSSALIQPPVGVFYLGAAVVMALAQLSALPDLLARVRQR